MKAGSDDSNWDLIIRPQRSVFEFNFRELWRYRDLLVLFVKRDYKSIYKQTVLGPLWFIIQPVLTTITFLIIFARIADIPTNGIPPVLFYMSGIVLWNYFSDCLLKTSDTFQANKGMFGKVYFPRLIVPISIVVSNFFRLAIQLLVFVSIYLYYLVTGHEMSVNISILWVPLLLLMMAGHGLAAGIIISSLTTKYRDLRYLLQFGVQLLMYASPVVYPLSSVPEKYQWLLQLNLMTPIIETFKYSLLGKGVYQPQFLLLAFVTMCILLFVGVLIFNRVQKSFMDTV